MIFSEFIRSAISKFCLKTPRKFLIFSNPGVYKLSIVHFSISVSHFDFLEKQNDFKTYVFVLIRRI